MVKIAPSILAADMNNLERDIKEVASLGADYIHIDVMDGKFVPNETNGLTMLKSAKNATDIVLDVHLMVENPLEYMKPFIKDADIITFHVEAVDKFQIEEIIKNLKDKSKKVGIALKPKTPITEIIPFLEKIDMVLIMTVEPGFGGQELILETIQKIKELRKLKPDLDIEVDGGINLDTVAFVKEAGANVLVAGTAIFKSKDKRKTIDELRN